jgi:hypothetical protein
VKRSRADWEKLIAEFERGSESQVQFCARRSVAVATLQYWLRRLRRGDREKSVSVVPVRLSDGATGRPGVEAELGSLRLRFEEGLAPEYIAAVLRALAMPC